MPVFELPMVGSGQQVLVDTGVLVAGLLGSSAQCVAFLTRCAREEVLAYVTVEVLNEVCHKLMLIEAHSKSLIPRPTAAALRSRSHVIPLLTDYWAQLQRLREMSLAIMPLDEDRLYAAQDFRHLYHLLTMDSVILAAASQFGLIAMATLDSDFEVVPWLAVFKPTDMPSP